MINRIQFISQQTNSFSHIDCIYSACEAGIKWVQLRMKDQPEEEVLTTAKQARQICNEYGAKLIINDYPLIAAHIGADGLHLGKEDMPVKEARRILGAGQIIGATANTFEDIRRHHADGADYVGLGPLRFTTTKKKLSPILGLEGYRHITAQCREAGISLPLIAIGGIELKDIAPLRDAGIYGIAVSGLIATASDPKQTVQKIFEQIQTTQTLC